MLKLLAPNLGKLRRKRNVRALTRALTYEYSKATRMAAANALADLQDPRAIEPLVNAMKDYDGDVREAAADALQRLGWRPATDEERGLFIIAKKQWSEAAGLGEAPVLHFYRVLHDRDEAVRRGAKQSLVLIGAPAIPFLVNTLNKPILLSQLYAPVAEALFDVLTHVGEPSVPPLLDAIRIAARGMGPTSHFELALAKLGAPAVPSLVGALVDKDTSVRVAAAKALGAIKSVQSLQPLANALRDTSAAVRAAAASALGEFGDQSHLSSLESCLQDRSREVRELSRAAISAIKLRADPHSPLHHQRT